MRIKLYYTADEISNNLYTYGSEFMTEDNVEYIGTYHEYITGERYTGATWNAKLSKKLVAFRNLSDKLVEYQNLKPLTLQYESPKSHIVSITNQHRLSGIINRYFFNKVNDNFIFEVDRTQYENWSAKKIDNVIYSALIIPWSITGNLDDVIVNNVKTLGVRTKNNLQIEAASRTMPSIRNILTNPIQFYQDITFSVPKDINE